MHFVQIMTLLSCHLIYHGNLHIHHFYLIICYFLLHKNVSDYHRPIALKCILKNRCHDIRTIWNSKNSFQSDRVMLRKSAGWKISIIEKRHDLITEIRTMGAWFPRFLWAIFLSYLSLFRYWSWISTEPLGYMVYLPFLYSCTFLRPISEGFTDIKHLLHVKFQTHLLQK